MVKKQNQGGSITVIMLAVLSLAMVLGTALFAVGQVMAYRAQAQTHADVAAIYTAEMIWNEFLPLAQACDKAAGYLGREGFSLVECREEGVSVQVRVLKPLKLGGLGGMEAIGVSRAGPVTE